MNNKYLASAEAFYIGHFFSQDDNFEDAMKSALGIKEKLDPPETIGENIKFSLDGINIDDVEPCGKGKFHITITISYHTYLSVEAEDCIVASSIADKRVEDENVPDFFGDFKLDMKYVYDLAMLPPEVY